jgi:predicted MFS family arabinose efflux permease
MDFGRLAWALRITGISSFVMLVTASILMKDRNSSVRPDIHPCNLRLLRQKGVVLLVGYTFFAILGYIVSIYSLGAFALSIGLTQHQAGNAIALLNTGTALGRPFMGVLSDRLGRITVAGTVTASNSILALAFWIPINSYAALLVYALITGATGGLYWGTIAPLCAEVVPLADLPST